MSFRGKIVSTGKLYKPLAEKHKCRKYSNRLQVGTKKIFADHSESRFCKLGFVYFRESKTCATYRSRAEDVERRILNNITNAYETSH